MRENADPSAQTSAVEGAGVHQPPVDGEAARQPSIQGPILEEVGVRQTAVHDAGDRTGRADGVGVGQPGVDDAGARQAAVDGPGVHESGVHKVGVDGPGGLGASVHGSGEQPVGNQDCVVLDIGGEVGALILYAPAELSGAEVEISLPGAGPRTHSIVRERRIERSASGRRTAGRHAAPSGPGDTAVYAAVYPGLPAGVYTIWRDAQTPAGTVQVEGGQVASWLWDSPNKQPS